MIWDNVLQCSWPFKDQTKVKRKDIPLWLHYGIFIYKISDIQVYTQMYGQLNTLLYSIILTPVCYMSTLVMPGLMIVSFVHTKYFHSQFSVWS